MNGLTNAHKYVMVLALSFLAGVCEAASDGKPGWPDYLRHGFLGLGPAVVALNLTLQKAA